MGIITDAPPPFEAGTGANPLLGGGSVEPTPRSSRAFWWGVGPANFAGPYRRHKLPEASEEIQDPHNMVLEVWTESGFLAMAALLASLGLGLGQIWHPLVRIGRSRLPRTKHRRRRLPRGTAG